MNDILFGNSNRPVIKKLSNRYFKAGKSRNIIAIIAIALTTILFTTIFTLGSGLIDTVHDQNIRKQGGDGQAVLNYISDEVFDNIKGKKILKSSVLIEFEPNFQHFFTTKESFIKTNDPKLENAANSNLEMVLSYIGANRENFFKIKIRLLL